MRKRIMGPPGTGKTTTLMQIVEDALAAGVPPEKIGFFSFSRAAIREAKLRAFKRFGLSDKQLPHFRTLHSHAFKGTTGQPKMLGHEFWRELLEDTLMAPVMVNDPFDEWSATRVTRYAHSLPVVRAAVDIEAQPDRDIDEVLLSGGHHDVKRKFVEEFLAKYKRKKRAESVYDYADLLRLFMEDGVCPKLDICCIDEAQDLNGDLWNIAEALEVMSDVTYYAGDDDQAVFKYNGADPDRFRDMECDETTVLDQSYRVPRILHRRAMRSINRVKERYPKDYRPTDQEGDYRLASSVSDIPVEEGEWLILSWSRHHAESVEAELRARAVPHETSGGLNWPDQTYAKAVRAWKALQKHGRADITDIQCLYKCLPYCGKLGVGKGGKMGMDILDRGRDGQVGLEELRTDFALRAPVDEHWRNHLNRIPIGNSNRFFELDGNALLEMVNLFDIAGNSVYTTPRVRVCTVHQAKGAEADNVVLINMMPAKTVKALQGDDPAVHQVAYVAITRARETFWDVVYIEDEPPQHVSHYQY